MFPGGAYPGRVETCMGKFLVGGCQGVGWFLFECH